MTARDSFEVSDAADLLLFSETSSAMNLSPSAYANDAAMLMNLAVAPAMAPAFANPPQNRTAIREYVASHVDEHTPLVFLARTQAAGSTIYIEAGAGAGKTTLAERLMSSAKTDQKGAKRQIIATTMTKAGVHALKGRADIPSSSVQSLHSLGFQALCKAYSYKMMVAIQRHGAQTGLDSNGGGDRMSSPLLPSQKDQALTHDDIRLPLPHASKYTIMCQCLMPPTAFDQESNMHSPDIVSAAYTLMSNFVTGLANKGMEAGMGQPGAASMDDHDCLLELSTRYSLDGTLEKHYQMLSTELQHLCNRSVAVIHKFGPSILSGPFDELKTAIHSFATDFDFTKHVAAETRLHAGLIMTSHLLQEGMKVAMRPVWRGASRFVNVFDAKDFMQLPALTFPEMVGLPCNSSIQAPILARNGKPYDMILIDEAQDSNLAQVGLILWAAAPLTQLIVVGDPLQRCYSFASASALALQKLLAPRPIGVVDKCVLSNNFRCARHICEVIQTVLTEDVGADRIIRPVRHEHGEVLHRANLRNGLLHKWIAEGTVAILSRLNAVLAAFQAFFLKVGQPYAVLGRKGVLPQLLRLLEPFDDNTKMSAIVLHLKGSAQDEARSVEQRDHSLCVMIFASSLLPDAPSHTATSPKDRLCAHLETAYAGSTKTCENSTVRGMPILGNGHASKGHEFTTVILAEPGSAMIQSIIEQGGEEAEDEKHLKHVLVSRGRDRLVFLEDVFQEHGPRGIVNLCSPLMKVQPTVQEVALMNDMKRARACNVSNNSLDNSFGCTT